MNQVKIVKNIKNIKIFKTNLNYHDKLKSSKHIKYFTYLYC